MNVQPITFDDWLEVEDPVIKTDLFISQDFSSFETDPEIAKPYNDLYRITSLNIEEAKEDFKKRVKDVESTLQHLLKLHKMYQKLFPHMKAASIEIAKKIATL